MQITIKGHQVEVTPALHEYALGKFERLTRHFDQLHDLSIVLGVEKLLHKAEATMLLSGKTLHADATAPDMYAAIFAAGALGYGLNILFLLIEKSFVHWSGK